MRKVTIIFSLVTLLIAYVSPAWGAKKGVPERRGGGGTRWTAPQNKYSKVLFRNKLSAMAFASRNRLPISLRVKAFFG